MISTNERKRNRKKFRPNALVGAPDAHNDERAVNREARMSNIDLPSPLAPSADRQTAESSGTTMRLSGIGKRERHP